MEELMNNVQGRNSAFEPPIRRNGRLHIPQRTPPQRFIAPCFTGGLKGLLLQLCGKKPSSPQHKPGTQTDENGKFHPQHPGKHLKPLASNLDEVTHLVGRYKFLRIIGTGQSSVLIAAEDLYHHSNCAVAIKIMHLNYTTLGAQEADCIEQLNRADPLKVSKTVRLLNKFMFDGHYCMVFELLRPRPLHHYFQSAQFDSEEEKLQMIKGITVQLLGVLEFLKRENVIHADLKPENILLQEGKNIRIKVVDFGNAIRWIHREVSLYYDHFELQTLLYRAPEVIFGVRFGPEIDMWSLGCILAEMYLGEPLFFGRSKMNIVQEMVAVLGPLPHVPFQSGKFFSEFSSFSGQAPGLNIPSLVSRLMKRLHNMKNFMFAHFLAGLLRYDPNRRLTPVEAAAHPFLASEVPFGFLQDTSSTAHAYSGVLLTPNEYLHRPHIDDDIRRHHFSDLELLHVGTKGWSYLEQKTTCTPPVGRVVLLVHNEKKAVKEKCRTTVFSKTSDMGSEIKRDMPRPLENSPLPDNPHVMTGVKESSPVLQTTGNVKTYPGDRSVPNVRSSVQGTMGTPKLEQGLRTDSNIMVSESLRKSPRRTTNESAGKRLPNALPSPSLVLGNPTAASVTDLLHERLQNGLSPQNTKFRPQVDANSTSCGLEHEELPSTSRNDHGHQHFSSQRKGSLRNEITSNDSTAEVKMLKERTVGAGLVFRNTDKEIPAMSSTANEGYRLGDKRARVSVKELNDDDLSMNSARTRVYYRTKKKRMQVGGTEEIFEPRAQSFPSRTRPLNDEQRSGEELLPSSASVSLMSSAWSGSRNVTQKRLEKGNLTRNPSKARLSLDLLYSEEGDEVFLL